jgi:hypothetical protein
MRLEESNEKVFLADLVGSNLEIAAALEAAAEVVLAAAACRAAVETAL